MSKLYVQTKTYPDTPNYLIAHSSHQSVGDHLMSFRVKTGDNLALMAFYGGSQTRAWSVVVGEKQKQSSHNVQIISHRNY